MKTFKRFDFWMNVLIYVCLLIWCSITASFENIIIAYTIMGGWQVISMITHEFNGWFTSRTGTRRIYHWISLISLITLPFGFAWVLVFASPFMAAFYIFLCYKELYVKMKRPLALLK